MELSDAFFNFLQHAAFGMAQKIHNSIFNGAMESWCDIITGLLPRF